MFIRLRLHRIVWNWLTIRSIRWSVRWFRLKRSRVSWIVWKWRLFPKQLKAWWLMCPYIVSMYSVMSMWSKIFFVFTDIITWSSVTMWSQTWAIRLRPIAVINCRTWFPNSFAVAVSMRFWITRWPVRLTMTTFPLIRFLIVWCWWIRLVPIWIACARRCCSVAWKVSNIMRNAKMVISVSLNLGTATITISTIRKKMKHWLSSRKIIVWVCGWAVAVWITTGRIRMKNRLSTNWKPMWKISCFVSEWTCRRLFSAIWRTISIRQDWVSRLRPVASWVRWVLSARKYARKWILMRKSIMRNFLGRCWWRKSRKTRWLSLKSPNSRL